MNQINLCAESKFAHKSPYLYAKPIKLYNTLSITHHRELKLKYSDTNSFFPTQNFQLSSIQYQ